jgi:exodeoxyribonuclease V beta subunit
MMKVEHLNLINSPLEGTNLIEASAGTGKTYTITGLFLRLVLEKNLTVNEILVVTFTEAATEELRDRIRNKLREAIGVFSGEQSGDALLNDIVKKHKDVKAGLESFREALYAFDKAAIFTIHGFCRKILHENAFESGSLFDTELVADQENLKREIVDDFWRKHFYNASHLFANYAIQNKFNPDSLLSLLANRIAQPYLKSIPQNEIQESTFEEIEFQEYVSKVSKEWQKEKKEVVNILLNDKALKRNKYRKVSILGWIQSMDDYMAWGDNNPLLFKGFEKFTLSELKQAVKKNYDPPIHTFFELCEKLKDKQRRLAGLFEKRLLGLKANLFHYVQNELNKRKEAQNIQSFDDLLIKVHRALLKAGGEKLVRNMRMKFKAALIDEFQDTDPIQYAIFRKVFGTRNNALFLIGDPKQAIYSFRSADIFTYMKAAKDVKSKYTLGENWRSEPNLIKAINTIFASADPPFVYDEITFQPVLSAKDKDTEFLRIDGQFETPFHLWFINASKINESRKSLTKGKARELISKAVAIEISRLLNLGRNNRALLGKRPLKEGDIAVLVRKNDEAHIIKEDLSALNIPSVLYNTGNLFDSHEALEIERVLSSIVEPNNEKLIKTALTTDMIGVRGEELDYLQKDETGWNKWLVRFRNYHHLWNQYGFIRMFKYLLSEEKVLLRLMLLPDGERRNTNLLHLTEVLHQKSVERKLGMAGLLKWLSEQKDPASQRLEEYLLRLESDENAVKLVTIHKSKGLEYPVVFCPFTWDGSRIKGSKSPITFHDEAHNNELSIDLGSADMDKNRRFAEKEQLAENLRLLYVALTRAKNRCYFVWGRFNEAETSAPAYLFHKPESLDGENIVSATGERFKDLSDEVILTELKTILNKAGGTIRLSEIPMKEVGKYSPLSVKDEELTCQKFSGNIEQKWYISSFSSLVSGYPHSAELADRDEISLVDRYNIKDIKESPVEEKPSCIFLFPRGTKTGIFMHDIFQHLDFIQKDTSPMKGLVMQKLKEYGFELTWQESMYNMIQKVISLSLDPENCDLTLSRIRSQDRRSELEFYFPLKSISPRKLKNIFTVFAGNELPANFPERIERLDFSPVRGFMKGFIDMVFQFRGRFYLVDWKSNFLGTSVEDYGQEALAAVMEDEFYILQYHIYTVALNQYLNARLPGYKYETHFGSVYYIFLRGVDPEQGMDFGIYRDRPSERLINELHTNLINIEKSG